MPWWCPGGCLVPWWCPGGALVMPWWCPGGGIVALPVLRRDQRLLPPPPYSVPAGGRDDDMIAPLPLRREEGMGGGNV